MIQWIKLIVVNSDHMLLVSMRLIFAYHTYTDSTLVLRYIYMLLYGIFYINRWIEYIYSLSWLNISNAHPLLLATLVPMGTCFYNKLQGFAWGYSLSCMTRTVFFGSSHFPPKVLKHPFGFRHYVCDMFGSALELTGPWSHGPCCLLQAPATPPTSW